MVTTRKEAKMIEVLPIRYAYDPTSVLPHGWIVRIDGKQVGHTFVTRDAAERKADLYRLSRDW